MGHIITDLKEAFRRGNVYIQLIFINVGVFVITTLIGILLQLFNRSAAGIFELLALPASFTRFAWQPWSIFTYMFMHAGFLHILFNMLTLWCVGPVLERMMGHWPYLALYVLSGLGGGAGLMVWAVCSPSGWMTAAYGASGALFGLFAAILVVYRRIGIDIRSMLIWMLINFLMPVITPGIAWQAHVGGFIVGGVLAWLLVTGLHAFRGKSLTWRTTVHGITVFVVVVAIIVGCNAGNPLMHMSLLYQ